MRKYSGKLATTLAVGLFLANGANAGPVDPLYCNHDGTIQLIAMNACLDHTFAGNAPLGSDLEMHSEALSSDAGTAVHPKGYNPGLCLGTASTADSTDEHRAFDFLSPNNFAGLWWNAPDGSESGWGISLDYQGESKFTLTTAFDGSPA